MKPLVNEQLIHSAIAEAQQSYMTKVYAWMLVGLLITGFTSYLANINQWDLSIVANGLFWIVIIMQLGLVIALSGWIYKMPVPVAAMSFFIYSFLTGLTFAMIFRVYTTESIYNTFFIAAGMFGALSFFGYVTKKNLSAIGSFMFMGLIGLILASIVNIFLVNSALHFVISIIGVIVFAGLTAYDTQQIKEMYVLDAEGSDIATKGAIIGALKLYLDFINLFLFLLRIFGRRN